MAKVTGLGGVFLKSRDLAALRAWYAEHLGLKPEDWRGMKFDEDTARPGFTLWAPFAAHTGYFTPARSRTW